MKKVFYILILLILASCSPQKRIERIIKRHPEIQTTQTITDTVYIKPVSIDTVFLLEPQDTIIITDTSGLQIGIIRDENSFKLQAYEPGREIIFNKTVPKINIEKGDSGKKNKWKFDLRTFAAGIIGGLLLALLFFRALKWVKDF